MGLWWSGSFGARFFFFQWRLLNDTHFLPKWHVTQYRVRCYRQQRVIQNRNKFNVKDFSNRLFTHWFTRTGCHNYVSANVSCSLLPNTTDTWKVLENSNSRGDNSKFFLVFLSSWCHCCSFHGIRTYGIGPNPGLELIIIHLTNTYIYTITK